MPVIEKHYEPLGIVLHLDAMKPVEEVYQTLLKAINERTATPTGKSKSTAPK